MDDSFVQCIKDCSCKTALICAGLPAHDHNSSLGNTQRFIRNHQINIKFHLISQTKTIRAGSKRIIKRKASRLDLINTDLTIRAGKALTECLHSTIHRIYISNPSERFRTVSMESDNRFSIPGFTTRRSTIISILCLMFLSSLISSDSSYRFPSICTRT